jgi:hypothetical protein
VKRDFVLWEQYLQHGSFVAFHDCNLLGPSKVIKERVIASGIYSEVIRADTIFVAQKI